MDKERKSELIFSAPTLEQVKPHINPEVVEIFLYQWERILKTIGLYSSSPLQKKTDQIRNSYFWQNLVKEILENKEYSTTRISKEISASPALICRLKQEKLSRVTMPLSIGEKLLVLHKTARPDLQKKEI